jgi:hypothetical protein
MVVFVARRIQVKSSNGSFTDHYLPCCNDARNHTFVSKTGVFYFTIPSAILQGQNLWHISYALKRRTAGTACNGEYVINLIIFSFN